MFPMLANGWRGEHVGEHGTAYPVKVCDDVRHARQRRSARQGDDGAYRALPAQVPSAKKKTNTAPPAGERAGAQSA